MMTAMTTEPALELEDVGVLEPLPDPPRAHDMLQRNSDTEFDTFLRAHFAHRADVLVGGAGFLRQNGGDPSERLAPDCVVAFGVDDPKAIVKRNGYVVREVGKPPDFVLEIASRATGRRDYTVKREMYAGYGVGEYWRFDWTGGRYHDAALAGDILVGGVYEPLPIQREPDGLVWGYSTALGLNLCWESGELRVFDPVAGQFLRKPEELRLYAESETERADAAEYRADAAESEARTLRERLRRLGSRG